MDPFQTELSGRYRCFTNIIYIFKKKKEKKREEQEEQEEEGKKKKNPQSKHI